MPDELEITKNGKVTQAALDLLIDAHEGFEKLKAQAREAKSAESRAKKSLDRLQTKILQAVKEGSRLPLGYQVQQHEKIKQARWSASAVAELVDYLTDGKMSFDDAEQLAVDKGWIGGRDEWETIDRGKMKLKMR